MQQAHHIERVMAAQSVLNFFYGMMNHRWPAIRNRPITRRDGAQVAREGIHLGGRGNDRCPARGNQRHSSAVGHLKDRFVDFLRLRAGLGSVHPARQPMRRCHYTKVSRTADTAAIPACAGTDDDRLVGVDRQHARADHPHMAWDDRDRQTARAWAAR